jgi:homoserine dehydrogenase
MQARPVKPLGDVRSRYYLHFQVHDRPGVLARIAGALGEAGVSIEQMVQEGGAGSSGVAVDIVLLTHHANERDLSRALDAIVQSGVVAAAPRLIRLLD